MRCYIQPECLKGEGQIQSCGRRCVNCQNRRNCQRSPELRGQNLTTDEHGSANCQECQNCQKSPKLKIQILPRINADQVNHENLNPDKHRLGGSKGGLAARMRLQLPSDPSHLCSSVIGFCFSILAILAISAILANYAAQKGDWRPNEITISIRSVSSVFISGRFLFFNSGNLWQFRRFWQFLKGSAAASAKTAPGESAASAATPA